MNLHALSFRWRMWWYRQHAPWWFKAGLVSLALLWLVIWCSGCAEFNAAKGTVDRYKAMAIDEAARAEDEYVQSAVFGLCRGASVGAIDRYFVTPDLQQARAILCGQSWAITCQDVLIRQRAACEALGP